MKLISSALAAANIESIDEESQTGIDIPLSDHSDNRAQIGAEIAH